MSTLFALISKRQQQRHHVKCLGIRLYWVDARATRASKKFILMSLEIIEKLGLRIAGSKQEFKFCLKTVKRQSTTVTRFPDKLQQTVPEWINKTCCKLLTCCKPLSCLESQYMQQINLINK